MTRFLSFIISGFLLGVSGAYSQNIIREADNEYDRKYTPPIGSPFNDMGTTRSGNSTEGVQEFHNSVKVVPTALLRLKVVGVLEKDLSNGFAAGVTLGKSFGTDFIQYLGLSLTDLATYGQDHYLRVDEVIDNASFDGSSPFAGVNFRGYFSGTTFDGGYVEMLYNYERTDYLLQTNANGYPVKGIRSASLRMHALGVGFGVTMNSGNFTNELFMNFGIKLFRADRFSRYEVPASAGSSGADYYYQKNGTMSLNPVFMINFGYALGFGF